MMGLLKELARVKMTLWMMMMIDCVWIESVTGDVYVVGDTTGWITLPDSNYYSNWASTKNFRVGDTILFQYDTNNHNVIQVNHLDFRTCNSSAPMKTYSTGNDSFTIKGPGHYYFICSFPGHCEAGQKLDVRVLKSYHLTSTPLTSPSPSPSIVTATSREGTEMAPSPAENAAVSARDPNWLLRSTIAAFLTGLAMWVHGFA